MELTNKKKSFFINTLIITGIIYPIMILIVFSVINISKVWNSWGINEFGVLNKPDVINYLLLIFFKLSLYLFPSMIIAVGLTIKDKEKITKNKYLYYLLSVLSIWFLGILTIKLFFEAILEVDRLFEFTLFESIKDIQTLIGFIITIVLKKNYELKEGFINTEKVKKII